MNRQVCPDWRIALVAGAPRKVTDEAQSELQAVVEQEPRAMGYPFSVWSSLRLALHLAKQGLGQVSAETIRRHLHQLGYRIIRPVLSIHSPDPAYATKAVQLAEYKDQARRREIILLFEDEIDLNLLPSVMRCWTKRGTQRQVRTPGQNVKRYGFGALK